MSLYIYKDIYIYMYNKKFIKSFRQEKRHRVKARLEEIEDAPELLEEKCMRLAAAISRATSLAVYTGAGISTAASIPDYRGTNGVWTRLQQGKDIG